MISVSSHVNELLAKCSQSLFALRTLRQHGLPPNALHAVFQAVVINKLIYASPAVLDMVSPAQQIVDDWTLYFDGQLGSAIVCSVSVI